jgi:Mlc titration factor MtfA (ptsG expression regulator)
MRWLRRLFPRNKPHIPEPLWQDCVRRLHFLDRLSANDLARLKALSEILLDTKPITGAGGLEVTDEIAVLIAIQACLIVLNLTLDLYDDMAGIIVYPSAFVVPQREVDEAGVVHEWREPLAGEAVEAGGAVILSWEDAECVEAFTAGQNLVIHEFAHKIDMGRGTANGCPPFLSAYHHDADVNLWQQSFSTGYAHFINRVYALDAQLPEDFDMNKAGDAAHYDALIAALPMDPYAATHPAEFFAVASEAFFVRPQPLAADYPEIYRLLAEYYRQEPLPLLAPEPVSLDANTRT